MIELSICKGNTCLRASAVGQQGDIVAFFVGVTILTIALVIVNNSVEA